MAAMAAMRLRLACDLPRLLGRDCLCAKKHKKPKSLANVAMFRLIDYLYAYRNLRVSGRDGRDGRDATATCLRLASIAWPQ